MPHSALNPSDKLIGRLSLYRRILERRLNSGEGQSHIFSHELAAITGGTAPLVRRDLMTIGCTGNPKKGYGIVELVEGIGRYLDPPEGTKAALVGVGNLGRALLSHFSLRHHKVPIVAAFDHHPDLVNRVIQGCRCYPVQEMEEKVREEDIKVGVLAVPAGAAQGLADQLVRAGVTGLVNFAPQALRVPESVFVDPIDMTMALEKTAFFARQKSQEKEFAK